jgi:hypothetical protein
MAQHTDSIVDIGSHELTYQGLTRPCTFWSEWHGIPLSTIAKGLERGYSPERILGPQPPSLRALRSKKHLFRNRYATIPQLVEILGFREEVVRSHFRVLKETRSEGPNHLYFKSKELGLYRHDLFKKLPKLPY